MSDPILSVRRLNSRSGSSAGEFDVQAGEWIGVVGRGESGKSSFLQSLCGEAPGYSIVRRRATLFAGPDAVPRGTPTNIAKKAAGGAKDTAAEALTALGLWDVRNSSTAALSPSRQAACSLLAPLATPESIVIVDGLFDQLDPIVVRDSIELLQNRLRQGSCALMGSHRPDLLARCDRLVRIESAQPAAWTTPEALLAASEPVELVVETQRADAVRAMVEPFAIEIAETPKGLAILARDGQATAAKLLLEGYGDVRLVLLRPPTFEAALVKFLEQPLVVKAAEGKHR